MTAATLYVIAVGREEPSYLGGLTDATTYWWAPRNRAARFTRPEAVQVAKDLDAAIRVNGYAPPPARIIPARGGADCSR